MRISIILSLVILLISCTGTNYYNQTMNSWRGSKSQDLIASLGQPEQTIKSPDGTETLIYYRSSPFNLENTPYQTTVFVVSRNGKAIGAQVPLSRPKPTLTGCTMIININKRDIITNVYFQGSHCTSLPRK